VYSRSHLLISLAVGAGVAWAFAHPYPPLALVAYAAVVGVGVDLDHFVLARRNTGSWAPVRRVLGDPVRAARDQSIIFETGEVWPIQRLFSHAVLGGVAVAVLLPVSPFLARFTGLVLYAHVLADLYADSRQERDYVRDLAPHVRGGE
jgi:hypothetical protein